MVQHRVEVPRREHDAEARTAELREILRAAPVRLGDDADAEAVSFKPARDYRVAEAGVVDVGVSRDNEDVEFIPAARLHVGPAHGEEGAPRRGGRSLWRLLRAEFIFIFKTAYRAVFFSGHLFYLRFFHFCAQKESGAAPYNFTIIDIL